MFFGYKCTQKIHFLQISGQKLAFFIKIPYICSTLFDKSET